MIENSGKDELLAEITKSAETEAEAIVRDAENSARQRIESAQAQAERIKRETRERAEERAREIKKARTANLEVQRKRILLHRQEELSKLVIERVLSNMRKLVRTPEYRDTFAASAAEACAGLGTESAVLEVSREEQHLLTDEMATRIQARVKALTGRTVEVNFAESFHTGTGVIAGSPDGRLLFDNRAEARIERHRNQIRRIIHREIIAKENG
ncbi:MAG: V-type ATP synthase subunit E [Spirochaetia bacterium]